MEASSALTEGSSRSAVREHDRIPDLESALEGLNREYVFVRSPVGVLFVPERELYRISDFRNLLANRFALNGDKTVRAAQAWIASRKRAECTKLVYEPAQVSGRLEDGSFNQYQGPSIEPREGDIGPWQKLLDHAFGGVAPRERAWFEQWVAYPLRHPGTKLFTAVVLWGVQGAGKSLLGETVGKLYGDNYYEPSADDLLNQFNDWLRFRQLILVNEILSTGNRPDADRLKAMITREYATINRKYQPQYRVRDCVNYFITSNHPDAVMVEDSERRFFVHRISRVIDTDLANEVARFKVSSDGQAALLHHFLHEVDLTGFDPHAPAPETAAKLDMVEAGISDLERFILDVTYAARLGEGPGLVTAEEIKAQFERLSRTNRTSVRAITASLQKFGAVNLGQMRVSGKRGRYWRLTETEKRPLAGEGI
jgi:hypothetical protein